MPTDPHPSEDETLIEILAGMADDVAKMICIMLAMLAIGVMLVGYGETIRAGADVLRGWW